MTPMTTTRTRMNTETTITPLASAYQNVVVKVVGFLRFIPPLPHLIGPWIR